MKLSEITTTTTREISSGLGALFSSLRRIPTRVKEFRNDTQAECRWWNELEVEERLAYVGGAQRPAECAVCDWLDIGESNRKEILDAAQAVQCWLSAISRR